MRGTLVNLALGFIAAVIATLTAHQGLVLVLNMAGLESRTPWSVAPVPPLEIPFIVNAAFWGGLWGILLALIYDRLPGNSVWIRGLLFGWLILVAGNCVLRPLLKGQPLFYGFDPAMFISPFVILSGFGIATAAVYVWLRERT